jgi:hypothetical protein
VSTIGLLSLLCLLVTGFICTAGIFSHHFDDTILQRVGLSIVATGTLIRAVERITQDVPDPPLVLLWSQIGIAMYAVGTALRMMHAKRRAGPERRHGDRRRRGLDIFKT